jgi:hypothetical protein
MESRKKLFFNIIIFIMILIGCSEQNSNVGFPGTSFVNGQTEITDFEMIYTFADTLFVFGNNPKLLLGKKDNIDCRVLLRFTNLPNDPLFVNDENATAQITLFINYKHPKIINPTIQVGLLQDKIFTRAHATWEKCNSTENWDIPGGDFLYLSSFTENITTETDSINIDLNAQVVKDWIASGAEGNYGLILFSENMTDSFIEFNSVLSTRRPRITLTYKDANDDDKSETRLAVWDTFIHNAQNDLNSNQLFISNIFPKSIYTHFELPIEKFQFPVNDIGVDFSRINITQAFLYLVVNEANTVFTNARYSITPALPRDDTVGEVKPSFDLSKVYRYTTTTDSLRTFDKPGYKEMRINIAAPLNLIIKNLRPNHGLILINNQSNLDLSSINFYGLDATENLRPRIEIRYSVYDPD